MRRCKAIGQEWKLVSLNGDQAVIENETGRYSILAKNVEVIKPQRKKRVSHKKVGSEKKADPEA